MDPSETQVGDLESARSVPPRKGPWSAIKDVFRRTKNRNTDVRIRKDIKKTDGDAGGFLSDADSGICADSPLREKNDDMFEHFGCVIFAEYKSRDMKNRDSCTSTRCPSVAGTDYEPKGNGSTITVLSDCKNVTIGNTTQIIINLPQPIVIIGREYIEDATSTNRTFTVDMHLEGLSRHIEQSIIEKLRGNDVIREIMHGNDYDVILDDVREGSIILSFTVSSNGANRMLRDIEGPDRVFADWLSQILSHLDMTDEQINLEIKKVICRKNDTNNALEIEGQAEWPSNQDVTNAPDLGIQEDFDPEGNDGGERAPGGSGSDSHCFRSLFKRICGGINKKIRLFTGEQKPHQVSHAMSRSDSHDSQAPCDSGYCSAQTTVTSTASLVKPTENLCDTDDGVCTGDAIYTHSASGYVNEVIVDVELNAVCGHIETHCQEH